MLSSILHSDLAFRPRRKIKACPRSLFGPWQLQGALHNNASRVLAFKQCADAFFKQILCQVPCHLLAYNRYATRRTAKLRPSHLLWYQTGAKENGNGKEPCTQTTPPFLVEININFLVTQLGSPSWWELKMLHFSAQSQAAMTCLGLIHWPSPNFMLLSCKYAISVYGNLCFGCMPRPITITWKIWGNSAPFLNLLFGFGFKLLATRS